MSVEPICNCGLIKASRAGATARSDGVKICNACQKPLGFTVRDDAEPAARLVPVDRVTTLAELPGHDTVRSLGVVTMLTSASGLTAESKGNSALSTAMQSFNARAAGMGANAILGFSASTFGAGGGITSAFGGDAVGVLLTGTAVVVTPRSERPDAEAAADSTA